MMGRKILWFIAGTVLVIVGAALFLPTFLSSQKLEREIIARLEAASGTTIRRLGPVQISYSPQLRISLDELLITASGRDEPVGRVKSLVAEISPVSLLLGSQSLSKFVLVEPEFRMTNGWPGLSANLSAFLSGTGGQSLVIDIQNGSLVAENDLPSSGTDLDEARPELAKISLPRSSLLKLNGILQLDQKGQSAGFTGEAAIFGELTAIDISAVRMVSEVESLSIDGSLIWPDGSFAANGTLTQAFEAESATEDAASTTAFQGQVALDLEQEAPTGNAVLAALGITAPQWPVSMTSALTFDERQLTLNEMRLELGAQTAEGSLAYIFEDEIATLSGTLAFEDLDGTPLLESFLPSYGDETAAEIFSPLNRFSTDLRWSADRLLLDRVVVEQAAGGLRTDAISSQVDIGSALWNGTAISGSAKVAAGSEGKSIREWTLNLTDLDFGLLTDQTEFIPPFIEGTGDVMLKASTEAGRSHPLAALSIVARDAQLNLIDLTGPDEIAIGPTLFDRMEIDLTWNAGAAAISKLAAATAERELYLTGAFASSGALDLKGEAVFKDDNSDTTIRLLDIGGTISEPELKVVPSVPLN